MNTQFQLQSGTPEFSVSVARSFSRLDSLFVTLHGQTSATVRDVTTFIAANPQEINGRIQIGAKQWPHGQNVSGVAQFWYRLLSGLGVMHSATHTLDITRAQYENGSFVWMTDTEKVPVAKSTGYNCSKGELITVTMKGLSNTHQRALVMCHHAVILELRDSGAEVLV